MLGHKYQDKYPSHGLIAQKLGVCRRTVLRAMHWLRDAGYISWKGRVCEKCSGRLLRTSNSYKINAEKLVARSPKIAEDSDITPEFNGIARVDSNEESEQESNNQEGVTTDNDNPGEVLPSTCYNYNNIYNIHDKGKGSYSYMRRSLKTFLSAWFSTDQHTFQVLPEADWCTGRPRVMHGQSDSLFDTLMHLNKAGNSIHVSINDTDLKGRKLENITKINGFVLDLDGAPVKPVIDFTLEHGFEPTIVVESSPGRYHFYWRVKSCNFSDFKRIQRAIALRFDGDLQCCVNKTMRLPGFFHLKGDPHFVKLRHVGEAVYDVDDVKKLFGVKDELPKKRRYSSFAPSGKMWANPEYGAVKGERNWSMFRFVCRMRTFGVDFAEAQHHASRYAAACSPALPEREALMMVKRVWRNYPEGRS